jgi:hypothetical protein
MSKEKKGNKETKKPKAPLDATKKQVNFSTSFQMVIGDDISQLKSSIPNSVMKN